MVRAEGGSRTHMHRILSAAALPICLPQPGARGGIRTRNHRLLRPVALPCWRTRARYQRSVRRSQSSTADKRDVGKRGCCHRRVSSQVQRLVSGIENNSADLPVFGTEFRGPSGRRQARWLRGCRNARCCPRRIMPGHFFLVLPQLTQGPAAPSPGVASHCRPHARHVIVLYVRSTPRRLVVFIRCRRTTHHHGPITAGHHSARVHR